MKQEFREEGVKIRSGERYLGSFVGDEEEKVSWVKEKMMEWEEGVKHIGVVAKHQPQCAYAGFQRALQQEWHFIQRNIDMDGSHCEGLEKAIDEDLLTQFFDTEIPNQDLLSIGVKQGGLGIPRPSQTPKKHREAARSMTSHLVESLNGESPFCLATHKRMVTDTRQMCRKANEEEGSHILEDVCETLSPKVKRVIRRAGKTGNWLSVHPREHNGKELAAVEWRDSLAIRFGNTPKDLQKICDGCGQDNSFTHEMDCKKGGLVIMHHNEIIDELCFLAEAALTPSAVHDEPLITFSQNMHKGEGLISHENRCDLMIRGLWRRGCDSVIDVQVSNLDNISHKDRACDKVLAALENKKRGKYEKDCLEARHSFSPFVQSVDGLLGKRAKGVLNCISSHLSKKWN